MEPIPLQTLLDIFSSMKQGCTRVLTGSRQFSWLLAGFDCAPSAHVLSYMSEYQSKQLESDVAT
ncbi:hypothetical protein VSR68_23375 [Paraburkholderia phymatum]|uniref:hypothetical protein n=1 Tax=Paraburkholderia phymatum TaxID=148447 RepID=UPI00317D84B5